MLTPEYLIDLALKEDIGDGDHTSISCIPSNATGEAKLLVKDSGIIAGVAIAKLIFSRFDNQLIFNEKISDGSPINPGDIVFTVKGSSRNILTTERLVLNYMQRMSGVATKTQSLVKMISHTKCRLLDTRKTTPLNRYFEKLAVKIGGGENHRFGLYDMVMIKDNHADFAGGITKAITRVKEYLIKENKELKIEVEARSIKEVQEIMDCGGIHRIMLDNFSVQDLKEAMKLISGKYETECSGGVTEKNIVPYAETGVDYISVGALTHNVKGLDLSLKAC